MRRGRIRRRHPTGGRLRTFRLRVVPDRAAIWQRGSVYRHRHANQRIQRNGFNQLRKFARRRNNFSGWAVRWSPQEPLSVTFNASQTATLGNVTVTVQGSSGTLTHSTPVAVSVTAALSFELNVSPSTVNIGPNALASAQITLVPGSNFGDSTVFISSSSAQIGNTGVDMSLSSEFLSAAQPTSTVAFQSLFEVQVENGIAVPITASVGSQILNLPLTLNITNPAPACAGPSRSTTRRTDMDPTGVIYDPVHKLVFAAVDQTNSVEVYSAADAHTVASIPIPAARALDISSDGSRILVGSQTRYLSWVDPNSLEVVEQVPMVSSLFNGGLPPTPLRPIILASGKVLVGGNGGALWNGIPQRIPGGTRRPRSFHPETAPFGAVPTIPKWLLQLLSKILWLFLIWLPTPTDRYKTSTLRQRH